MDLSKVGLKETEILLPGKDYETWAVVACDQYTSQKDVWMEIDKYVDDKPSTLRLILPEVYLEEEDVAERRAKINRKMREYLSDGVFTEAVNSMIYVERQTTTGVRKGIVAAVDLDEYDYTADSSALIRSTEETIADRLPPRVAIRMQAELELPHIMLLIDDQKSTVIEPLKEMVTEKEVLYDFDLMTNGGHIKGYKINETATESVAESLYQLKIKNNGLLFAVGDGNHSLATAKECWEMQKQHSQPNNKAKYALVEIVNVHDNALEFEPIHRVLYNCGKDAVEEFIKLLPASDSKNAGSVMCFFEGSKHKITLPGDRLSVAYIEEAVEKFIGFNPDVKVDYVHGDEVAKKLGKEEGTLSIILPAFEKNLLFKTVEKVGQLPRKSFSMGHAQDKRYYIECRKIK